MGSRLENKSTEVRKRIEGHIFEDEGGEEYEGSKFGGFSEYFRRKKIKLQNLDAQLRSETAQNPPIFRGIVAHVNGYTQPSLNDLHHLIVSHGGGFLQYLDGKTMVTHIIASNLTPKKVVEFKRYRIVKPAWIVDSVNAGKLQPWENYRVVDEGAKQKVLQFENGSITSQVNKKSTGYRDQTDTSWYTAQLARETQEAQQDFGKPAAGVSFDSNDFTSSGEPNNPTVEKADEAALQDPNNIKSQEVEYGASLLDSGHAEDSRAVESHQPASRDLEDLGRSEAPPPAEQVAQNEQSPQEVLRLDNGDDSDGAAYESKDTNWPRERASSFAGNLNGKSFVTTNDYEKLWSKRTIDGGVEGPPAKRSKMSAEEHNAILLSDPRIRKSSVLNPGFLEQYYRESRLHHLSAWKAELKSQIQAMTAEQSSTQKARQKRAPNARRYVLHVDFDSFFVAVSLKNFPQYQDKPAVVAHGSGSGSEIASCNYPARKFGVKNGMWMRRGLELCSDLKVLPYDFPAYEAASRLFYEAIMSTGGIVQSVSIDEALVDVSVACIEAGGTDGTSVREGSIWREQKKAEDIAQGLRDKVKEQTGCAVSVGIGGNILLAKVALRKAKPAGQHHVKPEDALEFLAGLEIQSLPGVAYSIGGKLEEIGIKLVRDIREVTKERLVSVLGPKTGEKIWSYSRGIDRTEVGDQVTRKSVSAEVNWGVRFETQEQADEFVENLSGELSRRLEREGVRGKHLTMKIMRRAQDAPLDPPKHLGHGKCDTYNKSVVLGVATMDKAAIAKEALSIMHGFAFSPGELRGLGVQMTKLQPLRASIGSKANASQPKLQFQKGGAAQHTRSEETHAPPPSSQRPTESSQRHLQFATKPADKQSVLPADPIQDGPETPRRPRQVQFTDAVPRHIDSPSRKPLNTAGTQFILPTQVDPKVLAELPEDIRSRLAKHTKPNQLNVARPEHDREPSTAKPAAFTALPSESQLDPEILQALPPDVRAEILSQYGKSPTKPARGAQSVLPQSPRKNRLLKTASKPGPSRGKARGGSLLTRLKGAATTRSNPTLTQTNFVAAAANRATSHDPHTDTDNTDTDAPAPPPLQVSDDFLQALPPDIRAEVLEHQRREQLRRTGGIEVSRRRRQLQQRARTQPDAPTGGRVLLLDARPPRPTFTVRRLWRADDLRGALRDWLDEFADSGPYDEDVAALCKYLGAVAGEEGDMRKAVDVVRWLGWMVEEAAGEGRLAEGSGEDGDARGKWRGAVEEARKAVSEVVRRRGLGDVDFEM